MNIFYFFMSTNKAILKRAKEEISNMRYEDAIELVNRILNFDPEDYTS